MPSLVPDLVKKRCKTISADVQSSVATKLAAVGGSFRVTASMKAALPAGVLSSAVAPVFGFA